MNHGQKELRIKTTWIDVDGNNVIVGVLRKSGSTPLMEAPFVVKGFNEENGTGLRLIRHTVADRLLLAFTQRWREIPDAFPIPVCMAIAYEFPGKKIEASIVLANEREPKVVLANTGAAKGERNVAVLVPDIAAQDIIRERNEYIINVPDERLILVPDFPESSRKFKTFLTGRGWERSYDDYTYYETYKDTLVPTGSGFSLGLGNDLRMLNRRDHGSYVGLLVRHKEIGCVWDRQLIDASLGASSTCGVIVEIPEEDFVKISRAPNRTIFRPIQIIIKKIEAAAKASCLSVA